MKLKKNPDVDLGKNSGLYFAIGLNIMLLITYNLLEYKTYDKDEIDIGLLDVNLELEDDIPIVKFDAPPPPPPPPAPEVITIVENVEEVEETVIESTETTMEEKIEPVVIEDVKVEEIEEDVEVPFSVVEKIPVYPGCEGLSKSESKKCFQSKIQAHIKKNFKYPETAQELGINGKVYVLFVIDANGKTSNIRTRGPDRMLEKEASRIISLLPKMTPGKQRGKSVKVPYSIPIHFKLASN